VSRWVSRRSSESFGSRGGIRRVAGDESLAGPGEGAGMNGEQDEQLVLAPHIDHGALMECKAHGDGWASPALAKGADPHVDGFGGVTETC
jgi:hypothetical protein